MKRIGMALLALGLLACATQAQQTTDKPADKAPAKAPAKATASAPASGTAKAGSPDTSAAGQGLTTEKQRMSYAIGMQTGKGVQAQGLDVDTNLVIQGLKDALSGAKSQMSDEDLGKEMKNLQQQIRDKQAKEAQAAATENKTKGEAFLSENAKKEGVVSLPDGLQYKIISTGQGKKPAETDTVLCNYKGTFIDGKEFDSNAKAGKPVTFSVGGVIPGFKEILQLMPVGSKWQVFIPSNLAYGERGTGNGVIGPNSALVFEIELVGIQDASASAPQAKQ